MKLYILRPIKRNDLWEPWYDKSFGCVVRAKNEEEARRIASEQHGDEGVDAWLYKKNSSCEILSTKGKSKLIIRDFAAA